MTPVSINLDTSIKAFQKEFQRAPETIVRAPGRVNIIGEHTDYNHGFVLPMALEQATYILAARRPDRQLNAWAANMDTRRLASLDARVRRDDDPWMDYLMGVADELIKLEHPVSGADLMIQGDVPVGCGLSSSAALEMAALCMFESLGDFRLEGPDAALLGQRVENHFLGLSTGIMDQFISRCGQAGSALFLDCRSFQYELIPVAFSNAVFIIANTKCARGLTASKYNERVAECAEAVQALAGKIPNPGTHLRDFTLDDLNTCQGRMGNTAFRRARHVITENERTLCACDAMRAGDAAALGALMNASGDSLRDDYEVTSPELNAMTDAARMLPGCYGARMTGAGFGGCTINLVADNEAESFARALMVEYARITGISGEIIVSRPGEGAVILR